jgi:ABC-type glutathione transport system ATPase component
MSLIDAHGSLWVSVSNSLKANQLQSEQELLKNITAHVRSGEAWGSSHLVTTVERCSSLRCPKVLAIIGGSGAGKTTLLDTAPWIPWLPWLSKGT